MASSDDEGGGEEGAASPEGGGKKGRKKDKKESKKDKKAKAAAALAAASGGAAADGDGGGGGGAAEGGGGGGGGGVSAAADMKYRGAKADLSYLMPILSVFHPSFTLVGTQPSLMLCLSGGLVVKCNRPGSERAVHSAPLFLPRPLATEDEVTYISPISPVYLPIYLPYISALPPPPPRHRG